MAWISRSHQGCMVSGASTCQRCPLHLVRARVHVRVSLVTHIYRSWDCQIMSEGTWQSDVNQSRDSQTPSLSHTCPSRTCQSHIITARIVRDYVRWYFHSWDYLRLCQSHICWSHIIQTVLVRPFESRTCHSRVLMNTQKGYSTNLMRKISIISGWSTAAHIQAKVSYPHYVHIVIG